MKILLVHNYYKQRGGEDESFDAEVALLESLGHEVRKYTRHNDSIDQRSKTKVALETFWNRQSQRDVAKILRDFDADVMHATNLFPLISPSIYKAANLARVPVVQSLRNYRHFCVNSFLHRDGKICERCLDKKIGLSGVTKACYKNSVMGSTVLTAHNSYHRFWKTWEQRVDRFFTPTEFARQKYIQADFDGDKIAVKPNFLSPDPGLSSQPREFALFVGRLAPEKGVKTLVETWASLKTDLPLKIVGSGILDKYVARADKANANIHHVGQLPLEEVKDVIGRAKFLIMPSEWYETFGRTIMESFSRGTPVIASDLGAMSEIVRENHNGLKFAPGDQTELADRIMRLVNDEPLRQRMGQAARETYSTSYTGAANHEVLMQVYQDAIVKHGIQYEDNLNSLDGV